MSLKLRSKIPNSLGSWDRYERLLKQVPFSSFGFNCDLADVNFFSNRYRLANSYRGLRLDGYSIQRPTVDAYGALNRVLLSYSAFEAFMGIIAQSKTQAKKNYSVDAISSQLLAKLEALNDFIILVQHLHKHAENHTKSCLQKFLNGQKNEFHSVAAGLRHIYAHGILSSSPDNIKPDELIQICNLISDHLLSYMDRGFTNIIDISS